MHKKLTYEQSGVNINTADETKKEIAKYMDNKSKNVLNKTGAFASLYDFSNINIKNPVLVLKTEEPGTKQKLAVEYGKLKNISYDMINHLTNDILVMGATPLTVQDAIICGKLEKAVVSDLVKYIAEACAENGSVLTGGETSEQPNVLDAGIYVLTSSIVGVVDRDKIIDGSKIENGDIVLALASNGIHTNGLSFLRRMMADDPLVKDELIDAQKFIDVILKPHRSYYKELIGLFENKELRGMAHITGGGITGNLNRILPENLDAEIDLSLYRVLPIFKFIKAKTGADDLELLKTFNMGVGMAIVVKRGSEEFFIKHFKGFNLDCYKIGEIVKGSKVVRVKGNIKY